MPKPTGKVSQALKFLNNFLTGNQYKLKRAELTLTMEDNKNPFRSDKVDVKEINLDLEIIAISQKLASEFIKETLNSDFIKNSIAVQNEQLEIAKDFNKNADAKKILLVKNLTQDSLDNAIEKKVKFDSYTTDLNPFRIHPKDFNDKGIAHYAFVDKDNKLVGKPHTLHLNSELKKLPDFKDLQHNIGLIKQNLQGIINQTNTEKQVEGSFKKLYDDDMYTSLKKYKEVQDDVQKLMEDAKSYCLNSIKNTKHLTASGQAKSLYADLGQFIAQNSRALTKAIQSVKKGDPNPNLDKMIDGFFEPYINGIRAANISELDKTKLKAEIARVKTELNKAMDLESTTSFQKVSVTLAIISAVCVATTICLMHPAVNKWVVNHLSNGKSFPGAKQIDLIVKSICEFSSTITKDQQSATLFSVMSAGSACMIIGSFSENKNLKKADLLNAQKLIGIVQGKEQGIA